MKAMYCAETSGEAWMQRIRALRWLSRVVCAVPRCCLCRKHKTLERAPARAGPSPACPSPAHDKPKWLSWFLDSYSKIPACIVVSAVMRLAWCFLHSAMM